MTYEEAKRLAESDDQSRAIKAWHDRIAAALQAGQKKAGIIPAPVCHSSDYWHEADGEAGALWSPNPAMDLAEVENEYFANAIEETGQSTTDEKQLEMVRRFEEIESQSHTLAERLESTGIPAYRQTPFGLWSYAIHSRNIRKIPAFRRVCILPYVAWQMRGPMVSALEYFLEKHPYCRFLTFTSGKRVPLRIPAYGPAEPLLRDRIAYLNRKISRLNAQPFMKAAGLEIVFRSDEFGTPETDENGNLKGDAGSIERDPDGTIWLHPHCHCVAWPKKGFIPPKKWAQLLKQIWAFWVHHWEEGGAIQTARECCKYVTKPAEMLKLSAAELAELYRQTRRMKLVQPLGALAAEIKAREEKNERLIKKATPNGEGRVYFEIKNWNKLRARTRAEKDFEEGKKFDAKEAGFFFRIMSRSVPSFCGAGLKECRVTIMATRFDEEKIRAHPDIAALIEATADAWAAGVFIRVHTCTPTVRPGPPPESESQRLLPVAAET